MEYTLITILFSFGAFGILMFWLGNKQGTNEGRRQILEENIKRDNLRLVQTAENLMILNLYDTNSQADIIKTVREPKQLLVT
jgi:hypothetical protein